MSQHFKSVFANVLQMIAVKYSVAKAELSGGDLGEVYMFISPNQSENLSEQDALANLKGVDQSMLKFLLGGYAELNGQQIKLIDGIGQWQETVENSLVAILESGINPDLARAYAASAGNMYNQYSVMLFFVSKMRPADLLLSVHCNVSLGIPQLRQLITKAGIEGSTIINHGELLNLSNYEIIVCCKGHGCRYEFQTLVDSLGKDESFFDEKQGLLEFIGSDTRQEASDMYQAEMDKVRKRHRHKFRAIKQLNAAHAKAMQTALGEEKAILETAIFSDNAIAALNRIYGVSDYTEDQYLGLLFDSSNLFLYTDDFPDAMK